jgi:hypothetical protein
MEAAVAAGITPISPNFTLPRNLSGERDSARYIRFITAFYPAV